MQPTDTDVQTPPLRSPGGRALVVSSTFLEADTLHAIGREAYSYQFVYRAFAPLLERWGTTTQVDRAPSRLDFALRGARRQGCSAMHLGFLPLHQLYLSTE